MWDRITHWPSTAEGVAWGGALYAALQFMCPDLKPLDPMTAVALIPVIRGALAKGPAPQVK